MSDPLIGSPKQVTAEIKGIDGIMHSIMRPALELDAHLVHGRPKSTCGRLVPPQLI